MPYKDTWGEKAQLRSKTRNEYFRNYKRERDKNKLIARGKVSLAVKRGVLKVEPCRDLDLNCRGRMEAHHPDYNRPLDVIWLCSYHHRLEDAALGKVARLPNGQQASKVCLDCGVDIRPPKQLYCSALCCQRMFRKKAN